MPSYLIDVNLPKYFSLWSGPDYQHVSDLNDEWLDSQIWVYAKEKTLTIVTKDADFSALAMLHGPPPRVIHVKLGNLKMNDFHQIVSAVWSEVCSLSSTHKLVRIYRDRIEGIL